MTKSRICKTATAKKRQAAPEGVRSETRRGQVGAALPRVGG